MESSSPNQILKRIQVLHAAVAVPLVVFAGIVYYLNNAEQTELTEDMKIFVYLPLGFMVISILLARPLYYNLLKKSKGKPFIERLNALMVATLTRDAIFEAAGLFAGVSSMVTGNNTTLFLVPIVVLQFYINRPTLFKIENELSATKEELSSLAD
jgi:hypothetical protein